MKRKWLLLLTLLLCGCGNTPKPAQTGTVQDDRLRLSASEEEKQSFTVFAMDTVMQFDAYGGSVDL